MCIRDRCIVLWWTAAHQKISICRHFLQKVYAAFKIQYLETIFLFIPSIQLPDWCFLFLKTPLFFSSALVDTHYTCTIALDDQLHLTDICTSGCMGKFDPIFFKLLFSSSVNHIQLNLHLLMRNQLQRHSRNWKNMNSSFFLDLSGIPISLLGDLFVKSPTYPP